MRTHARGKVQFSDPVVVRICTSRPKPKCLELGLLACCGKEGMVRSSCLLFCVVRVSQQLDLFALILTGGYFPSLLRRGQVGTSSFFTSLCLCRCQTPSNTTLGRESFPRVPSSRRMWRVQKMLGDASTTLTSSAIGPGSSDSLGGSNQTQSRTNKGGI